MKMILTQEKSEYHFLYTLAKGNSKQSIEVERIIFPKTRTITIKDKNDEEILTMKSSKVFLNSMMKFPLIGMFFELFSKQKKHYKILKHNEVIGNLCKDRSREKSPYILSYNGKKYYTYKRDHKETSFHIFEGDSQIGKVTKSTIEKHSKREFVGLFNSDVELEVISILMIYIEVVKYLKDIKTEYNAYKVQVKYEYPLSDSKTEIEDDWKPTK